MRCILNVCELQSDFWSVHNKLVLHRALAYQPKLLYSASRNSHLERDKFFHYLRVLCTDYLSNVSSLTILRCTCVPAAMGTKRVMHG